MLIIKEIVQHFEIMRGASIGEQITIIVEIEEMKIL